MATLVAPIGTPELAGKIRKSRWTAWRNLRRLREKHGDAVVTQDGPRCRLRTSLRALSKGDPHLVQMKELEREEVEQVVAARFRTRTVALEKRVADAEERAKSLETQVRELRETVSMLLRGVQVLAERCLPDSKG